MQFNDRLLDGIPITERGLCKLSLFCLQEGINLIAIVEQPGVVNRIRTIESQLWQGGAVVEDLINDNGQLILSEPLYVENPNLPELDVEGLRKHWSKSSIGAAGKMSTKHRVSKVLSDWMLDNPDYSMEQIVAAGKMYIDHCLTTGRLVMDIDNFIFNGTKSTLSTWIEEAAETEQHDDRRFI